MSASSTRRRPTIDRRLGLRSPAPQNLSIQGAEKANDRPEQAVAFLERWLAHCTPERRLAGDRRILMVDCATSHTALCMERAYVVLYHYGCAGPRHRLAWPVVAGVLPLGGDALHQATLGRSKLYFAAAAAAAVAMALRPWRLRWRQPSNSWRRSRRGERI